jgi:inhibitor of growth protein 3
MEEIQAKDKIIQECRSVINSRDASLQKFIRLNGSHAVNPKEDIYGKTILQNMDRSQVLQDEKVVLSEKACALLDRHIKKLDLKIRDLQNDGLLSNDPPIPSLFDNKDRYREPSKSIFSEATTGQATPLNPTSGNAPLQLSLAQRLNNATGRSSSASAFVASHIAARNSAPATPASAPHLQQRQRESSTGAAENKRRRLNVTVSNLPAMSSNLRQSSLGPGTPKAGTPGASRAGSAGPRGTTTTKKATTKKVAPHQQVRKIKAGAAIGKAPKRSSSATGRLKASQAAAAAARKKSPTSAGEVVEDEEEESILSSPEASDVENVNPSRRQAQRTVSDEEAEEEEDEAGEDTKAYCTCRSVSHGDMVACDNDNCPYEWFHWKCVGLTREPLGTWYCEECRKSLGK